MRQLHSHRLGGVGLPRLGIFPDLFLDLAQFLLHGHEVMEHAVERVGELLELVARADVDARLGEPDVVVYNAGARLQGPVAELDPAVVWDAIAITAFGGFLAVQQAAKRMIPRGHGAILLTGASASIKGFPLSSAFAMGKFALRGLAQSAARELGPKGIHVAHFIIDGSVRSAHRANPAGRPDSTLNPDSIAQTYVDVLRQPRDAWSLEVELRPWVETF